MIGFFVLNKDRFFLNFSQKMNCNSILKVLLVNPVKALTFNCDIICLSHRSRRSNFYFDLNARYFHDIYSSDDNVTWYI